MSAALQNDNTALARNWLSQLTGQDLSNLGSEQLARLAKEQLSLRNHSDMAELCSTSMQTPSPRESRSLSLTDSYLIVRVADKLVAFESLKVREIVPCCTYQKLQMRAGYFIGMTRIHGQPMALVDLAQMIGVDNRADHCQNLSLVLELAQGQIALAFDEMVNIGPISTSDSVGVAHIGISTKANMKFASGHARHNNQDVLIMSLNKMEQDTTITGLIATGERVRAADVWTKNIDTKQNRQLTHGRVMTILAGEEICLKLEDVNCVINLSNSNLPCQYIGGEPLLLNHLNKQFELYDLGDLLFGQPSTLDKLHYALAVETESKAIALGINQLLAIHVCEATYRVPRLGHRPPPGDGQHLQLVQVAGRGLIRRVHLDEINALLAKH